MSAPPVDSYTATTRLLPGWNKNHCDIENGKSERILLDNERVLLDEEDARPTRYDL
jgi:hypothetical protein